MAVDNLTIVAHAWLEGTNDFQQRIPNPTVHGINATMQALFDPMNRNYLNDFMNTLVCRIGYTFIHQQTFDNPLRVFKKSRLRYGSTIQEIVPKWIKAHSYVDDAEDVFKMSRPDVAQWFHSQNRQDRYDITIAREELRTAFTEDMGINRLIAAVLRVPQNSDEYDEYTIMKNLIAIYDRTWGFYRQQVSAVNSEASAKAFLKQVRTYSGKIPFPNTIFNNGAIPDIPIFAPANELVLFITPEIQASIDVDALAVLFHMDKADIKERTIVLDEFPIAGAQALLTTEDFFMCMDTEYTTTSQYNPKTLANNYWLHHWGVYSVSPFVPAILFTTESGTTVDTYTQTVTGMNFGVEKSTAAAGSIVLTNMDLIGTLLDGDGNAVTGDLSVRPDSATYNTTISRALTGVGGVYTVTVGAANTGDAVTIDGITTTVTASEDTAAKVATAIATSHASNSTYTVTASGAVVTFTEKSGKYGAGAPAISVSPTSSASDYTLATTTQPVVGQQTVTDIYTFVDKFGVLHVGPALKSGDTITIEAKSQYINPSGSTTQYVGYATVTVV